MSRNSWEGVLMDCGTGPSQRDSALFNSCRSVDSKISLTITSLLHV